MYISLFIMFYLSLRLILKISGIATLSEQLTEIPCKQSLIPGRRGYSSANRAGPALKPSKFVSSGYRK
jgi:hypothetical protein